jgi:4-carboxymuconolactone decarboxylase
MIHRTSARTGAEYEWGVHAVVFALADELHDTSTISDDLFARLQRHFTDDQILELTVTAGWYHVIAYVINAAGLLPEPWALPFPSS